MLIKITTGSTVMFSGSVPEEMVNTIVTYARGMKDSTWDGDAVIVKVADYFGLQKVDIMSKCRIIEYIRARAVIYAYLFYKKGFSKTEIAALFGKNHATIINGIKSARLNYKNAYKNIFGEDMI